MYYGPKVVVDNLVFSFDAANDKCTDSDNDVSSMRDTGPIAHSSRSDRGMTATGNTSAISITTTDGAETLDLGVTGANSTTDATNYNNRMVLDDDILFADQAAWSYEFWAKPSASAEHTFLSLCGRGATSPWLIWQHGSSTFYPRYRDNNGVYYRDSSSTNVSNPDDWHQVVFTADTSRNIGFYVDGAMLGGTIQAADTQMQTKMIGAGYSSSTNRFGFQGVLACVRIYSKTLSAAEVLQNFNATKGRFGL